MFLLQEGSFGYAMGLMMLCENKRVMGSVRRKDYTAYNEWKAAWTVLKFAPGSVGETNIVPVANISIARRTENLNIDISP